MKRLKISTKLGLLTFMFFLVSGLSNQVRAAEVKCIAELSRPGINTSIKNTPDINDDDYVIYVKCPWWDNTRPMMLHPELGDSGYATVLTAISLGRGVTLTLGAGTPYSLITRLEIANP